MRFEFATATRIIFGAGTFSETVPAAMEMGNRALLVTHTSLAAAAQLENQLQSRGVSVATFNVAGEPTTVSINAGVQLAREKNVDFVIGLGGGSALDSAKAIAIMLTNEGELLDYLEVIGKGRTFTRSAAPCIAIPTTSGTGAEVTRNAVLACPEHRVKVSLRSSLMYPRLAIIDPELTYSLPPSLTAATGMDALTQLIESYLCIRPNPFTDAISREGILRAAGALRQAYRDGTDLQAREAMSLASLCSGVTLANAGLGAVHGMAGPLGGTLSAPHGKICAWLLPLVMETNLRIIQEQKPDSPVLLRFSQVAEWLTGKTLVEAMAGVEWLYELRKDLHILPLSRFGLTEALIPKIVAQSQKAGSMKGNPIPLSDEQLALILQKSLE